MSKKSKLVLSNVSVSIKETNWNEYDEWETNIKKEKSKNDFYDGSQQQAQDDYDREEFEIIKNNH